MLITPRVYQLAQTPDRGAYEDHTRPRFHALTGWRNNPHVDLRRAAAMLLVHQAGSVRVGEVVRYVYTSPFLMLGSTPTYTTL